MASSKKQVEAWKASFAEQVRRRMDREGISKDYELARMLRIPQSTFSEHLKPSNKIRIETVQKVADLWPDEFASAPNEAYWLLHGRELSGPDPAVLRSLLVALEAIAETSSEALAQIKDIMSAEGGDDDQAGEAREAGGPGRDA